MLGWENLAVAIKDKFEGFSKKQKKTKTRGRPSVERRKKGWKKKYIEKVKKYINFYAKQCDHTHSFF